MDTEHISIEANPTFADVRFLEDRLYEYNVEKTGADSTFRTLFPGSIRVF